MVTSQANTILLHIFFCKTTNTKHSVHQISLNVCKCMSLAPLKLVCLLSEGKRTQMRLFRDRDGSGSVPHRDADLQKKEVYCLSRAPSFLGFDQVCFPCVCWCHDDGGVDSLINTLHDCMWCWERENTETTLLLLWTHCSEWGQILLICKTSLIVNKLHLVYYKW